MLSAPRMICGACTVWFKLKKHKPFNYFSVLLLVNFTCFVSQFTKLWHISYFALFYAVVCSYIRIRNKKLFSNASKGKPMNKKKKYGTTFVSFFPLIFP